MTTKQKKNRDYGLLTDGLLDRLIDGRIIDASEMYERFILSQQLGATLSLPVKHFSYKAR
jgi:hypothetical protein